MNEEYSVTVKMFLDGNQWAALLGENITVGVAGFGYSVNEAMAELVKQMDQCHRNWVDLLILIKPGCLTEVQDSCQLPDILPLLPRLRS